MVVGKSYDLVRMFPVIIKAFGRDGYRSSWLLSQVEIKSWIVGK